VHELRIAFRRLRQHPARNLAAALALAIGIGGTTAAFAAVNDVLLRDLPVDRQDELVVVSHLNPERGSLRIPFRPQTYDAVARGSGAMEVAGFSAWGTMPTVIETPDADQALRLVRVAGDFFGVLGTRPAQGRLLESADDRVGATPTAVLSHRAWRSRYASDPGVVGSSVVLDGTATTIVGVAAPGLDFPRGVEAWVSYRVDYASEAAPHELNVIGRTAPEADLATVAADVTATLVAARPEGWELLARSGPVVRPFEDEVLGAVRPVLSAALGAALLLLGAALANATLLLLAGGRAVEHELAVRSSLGAPRRRLIGRLMADAVVLCVVGGAAALLLASATVRYLVPLAPTELAQLEIVAIDWTSVALAGGLSLLAALSTALAAAALMLRRAVGGSLLAGGRAEARRSSLFRGAAAATQVGLAVVSAVGAVLLLRTVAALNRIDPGLAVHDMTAVSLAIPYGWLDVPPSYLDAVEEVVRDLESRPGIHAARPTLGPPLEQRLEVVLTAEGQDEEAVSGNPYVAVDAVLPGHFESMGIPLLAGRGIEEADDRPDAAPVVVVDEVLAGALWPGQDPLGKRINGFGHFETWFTVIGVTAATRYRELLEPHPRAYYPLRRMGNSPPATLLVRAEPGVPVARMVREAFARTDPQARVVDAQRMVDVLREPTEGRRFAARVLVSFAAATLLLAALGVYGVFTVFVQERTRELGVRRALGARRAHLANLVAASLARLAVTGAAAGIVVGIWASRFVESLLFEVAPVDPPTLVGVFAGSLFLAFVAGAAPALRATTAEPAVALRAE